jgi:hypothetical protein
MGTVMLVLDQPDQTSDRRGHGRRRRRFRLAALEQQLEETLVGGVDSPVLQRANAKNARQRRWSLLRVEKESFSSAVLQDSLQRALNRRQAAAKKADRYRDRRAVHAPQSSPTRQCQCAVGVAGNMFREGRSCSCVDGPARCSRDGDGDEDEPVDTHAQLTLTHCTPERV